jgi:uncharacterized membrane protein YedE/YeeE
MLLSLNGRLAGISGILGGFLLPARPGERIWRGLFLLGLVLGAGGYTFLSGTAVEARQGFPVSLLLLAGFLTGLGTTRANGCTSGHGVCGLARLSLRSLVATVTFLIVAIAATYLVRHGLGIGS